MNDGIKTSARGRVGFVLMASASSRTLNGLLLVFLSAIRRECRISETSEPFFHKIQGDITLRKLVIWVQALHVSKVKKIASLALTGCLLFAFPLVSAAAQSTSTITVTQGTNGTIIPDTVTVDNGTNQTFTMEPKSGYTIEDVKVDGSKTSVSSPWTDLGVQYGSTRIRSFAYLGGGRVVACGEVMLRSTDYGQTWANLGGFGVTILKLKYLENGIVLAGTGYPNGKILRSTDFGVHWTDLGTQYQQTTIYALTYLGNGLVLAGTYPGGLILRSTDYGATWTNMGRLGSETNVISMETFDNGIVVAGMANGNNGNIWRSTDYGDHWTNLGQQGGELDIDHIAHLGNGIAIASAYPDGKLLRSTDYGLNWIDLGIFDGKAMNNVAHMGNGMGVVGGALTGHMWKTVDYGATWMDLGQQGGEQWISSGYLENGIFLAGTGPIVNGSGLHGKILRSTAAGLGPTTTYTFSNVQAPHTITADYYLIPTPPVINSFLATPSSISLGQPANLNWDVSNATQISISPGNFQSTSSTGWLSVSPDTTTVYTLTASNGGTAYVTARATVQVIGAPVLTNVSASVSGLKVTVTWTTDQQTDEQVFYGPTQQLGSASPLGTNFQTTHRMTFYNLPRRTKFYYQAVSTNKKAQTGSSDIFSFTTSSKANVRGGVTITPGP